MVGSNSTLAARRRRFGAAHSSGPDTSLVEAERTRSASLHVDYVVLVRTSGMTSLESRGWNSGEKNAEEAG